MSSEVKSKAKTNSTSDSQPSQLSQSSQPTPPVNSGKYFLLSQQSSPRDIIARCMALNVFTLTIMQLWTIYGIHLEYWDLVFFWMSVTVGCSDLIDIHFHNIPGIIRWLFQKFNVTLVKAETILKFTGDEKTIGKNLTSCILIGFWIIGFAYNAQAIENGMRLFIICCWCVSPSSLYFNINSKSSMMNMKTLEKPLNLNILAIFSLFHAISITLITQVAPLITVSPPELIFSVEKCYLNIIISFPCTLLFILASNFIFVRTQLYFLNKVNEIDELKSLIDEQSTTLMNENDKMTSMNAVYVKKLQNLTLQTRTWNEEFKEILKAMAFRNRDSSPLALTIALMYLISSIQAFSSSFRSNDIGSLLQPLSNIAIAHRLSSLQNRPLS